MPVLIVLLRSSEARVTKLPTRSRFHPQRKTLFDDNIAATRFYAGMAT